MPETATPKLSSSSSMIALAAGAVGATLEAAAFAAFLARRDRYPAAQDYLVVADTLLALLALAGVGLAVRHPYRGSMVLGLAGIGSFLSDMAGLSTPPRMIPGGLMLLSAILTFALHGEEAKQAPSPTGHPHWLPVLVNVALVLHIVGGGFVGLGAGLVAPPLGVLTGWLIWAAVLFAGLRLRKSKPVLALITPFVGLSAWFLLLTIGGTFLGWTA